MLKLCVNSQPLRQCLQFIDCVWRLLVSAGGLCFRGLASRAWPSTRVAMRRPGGRLQGWARVRCSDKARVPHAWRHPGRLPSGGPCHGGGGLRRWAVPGGGRSGPGCRPAGGLSFRGLGSRTSLQLIGRRSSGLSFRGLASRAWPRIRIASRRSNWGCNICRCLRKCAIKCEAALP